MSEIHSNSKTDKKFVIPLRDDLRNEPIEDDEEQDEQQTKGFFKKCLHQIAECIEIHVEVKLSPRHHISNLTYVNFLGDILWEGPSAIGLSWTHLGVCSFLFSIAETWSIFNA